MPRRLLLLVLAGILAPASIHAQGGDEPRALGQEEAKPAPEPEKKPDAFQYFFGRGTSASKEREEQKDSAERKPVDAFDYFFGRNGKAGSAEEKPQNPPPLP